RCGVKAKSLQKASSCLPKNVDAKKPVCMREEQYLLEYECYINYLEVKLEQLYCLLKANEVDKTPGLSTTAKPARALFVRTATVMLSATSPLPAYRNESGSVAKGKSSKGTAAEFHQEGSWRDVADYLLPFGDVLGKARRRKAAKRNRGAIQWNRKHKEPDGANVPREANRERVRPTRSEVNSKHKDKHRYRDREVSKYGHVESAGHFKAIRGNRGGRPQRIKNRNRYPGERKRHNDSKQRRVPSRRRGQGSRDRWKPVRDLALEDYDNRLTRGATERRVDNPWEHYDRYKDQGEGYVRDRYPRRSKASGKRSYSRRRDASDR
ncbi:hypothetical protein MTO96_032489, partial [Rhipicephalus appendiculatus]